MTRRSEMKKIDHLTPEQIAKFPDYVRDAKEYAR
jgi:hypothetical protein